MSPPDASDPRAAPGLRTASGLRPLHCLLSAASLALLLSAPSALACDTRPVANGTASFNSCGTQWDWNSGDGEDLYLCRSCGDTTVLRITQRPIAEADLAMTRDELLQDWTKRVLPGQSDEYTVEMLESISIVEIGGNTGILIPARLTSSKDGTAMTSFAFRMPTAKHYVVANATGEGEPADIRRGLEQAVEHLSLVEEPAQ